MVESYGLMANHILPLTTSSSIKRISIPESSHSYIMSDFIQTINAMREMDLGDAIDLEMLHHAINTSIYHRGRPQMLLVTMSNGRKVQLFRRGKMQILGNVSLSETHSMFHEMIGILRNFYPHLHPNKVTLRNLVVSIQLQKIVALHNIQLSSDNLFYECELFPAALIRKWHPIHVAVFYNGKCILTGLSHMKQVMPIMDELVVYLSQQGLLPQ